MRTPYVAALVPNDDVIRDLRADLQKNFGEISGFYFGIDISEPSTVVYASIDVLNFKQYYDLIDILKKYNCHIL